MTLTIGQQLPNGWVIEQELKPLASATGGCFSRGYIVSKGLDKGFLKALDMAAAARNGPDPSRQLEAATRAFNYERDLLARCKTNRMTHVVLPLDEGHVSVPGQQLPTQYVILEFADRGDMRQAIMRGQQLNAAWLLRSLHQVCVGISQLHTHDIAHQDLKPSNILLCGSIAKIGDLGRSSRRGLPADHDTYAFAGDATYAPPELLYGYVSPDWSVHRFGCDLFHVGSIMSFCIHGINMTAQLLYNIPRSAWPKAGTRYQDVLPHLRTALDISLSTLGAWFSGPDGQDVVDMIRCLCDPDPDVRLSLARGPSSAQPLERYISRLDLLAKKAEIDLIRISQP